MTTETWKPVVGHEGLYEVSDLGSVRTAKRVAPRGACPSYTFKPRLLKKTKGGRANNYWRVMLEAAPRRHAYVHHLVLAAFVGPRPPDHVICHRNDDGFDNLLANLYYGTAEDNRADYIRNHQPEPADADLEGVPF